MHIILFILIGALFLEQLGQNFLYKKFDFIIDIIGNFYGSIFYFCGALAILLSVLILYKNIKNKQFKPNKWDICFLLLLVWGFFSVIFAKDKELAIIGSHRMDGYFSYLIYSSMYVGVRTLKNESIRLWLIRILALTTTSLCFDFIFNGSITSIFYNQNHFAYLLTIGSMLIAGLLIYEAKLFFKVLYGILFSINIFTLINVDTFGSYLAVMFAICFMAFYILSIKKEKAIIISIAAILVLFIGISIYTDSQTHILRKNFAVFGFDIGNVAANNESSDDAGSGRIRLWKHSLKYIKENPIFGIGPENSYNIFYEDGVGNDRPHNEYIQHALFMGIPAAVFYLAGLIMLFINCIKKRKQLPSFAIISGLSVFAYCISAFFGNTMYYTAPYYFMMLGMLSNPPLEKK